MQVKVCGITTRDDARAAAEFGADFVGLIRAGGQRQVALEAAQEIVASLPAKTTPVLVFRDAGLEEMCAALEVTGARWVQLHGAEPVTLVRELMQRVPGVNVIRAWEVAAASADEGLAEYVKEAAGAGVRFRAVILDAPKHRRHPGYACLGGVSRRCRGLADAMWCAGGLTVDNVEAAVRAGRYDGVDVARGVESRPGVKDREAMARFIAAAKVLEGAG
jgi:phosphoribosylanthranilate isomerase